MQQSVLEVVLRDRRRNTVWETAGVRKATCCVFLKKSSVGSKFLSRMGVEAVSLKRRTCNPVTGALH